MAAARIAKAKAGPQSQVPPEENDDILIAPWRADPNFNLWLDSVVERVSKACDIEAIKKEAGQPTNDLILGAELSRRRMAQALCKAFYAEPRTPKSKTQSQIVKIESRGFQMS